MLRKLHVGIWDVFICCTFWFYLATVNKLEYAISFTIFDYLLQNNSKKCMLALYFIVNLFIILIISLKFFMRTYFKTQSTRVSFLRSYEGYNFTIVDRESIVGRVFVEYYFLLQLVLRRYSRDDFSLKYI